MTWTKIDDQFYDHPKIVAAGSLGIALFVCGLSYCSRHLTDGFITEIQVPRLTDADEPQAIAKKLVKVGLWERRDGGYQIHDFLEYNPSAAKVKAERKRNARRQAEWRQRQEQVTAEETEDNAPTNNVTGGVTNNGPVPVPIPESPSPKEETPSAANAPALPSKPKSKRKSKEPKPKKPPAPAAVKVFRENAHRYPPKAWYSKIADAVGEQPVDLEFWGQIVLAYIGLGWNPGNVKNMLAYYEKREIPATKGQRESADAQPHAGIRQWLTEQGVEA